MRTKRQRIDEDSERDRTVRVVEVLAAETSRNKMLSPHDFAVPHGYTIQSARSRWQAIVWQRKTRHGLEIGFFLPYEAFCCDCGLFWLGGFEHERGW